MMSEPAPKSGSLLTGLRVACFYPWRDFEATGSWSRFANLWRYLLSQGASVTLVSFDHGPLAKLTNLQQRFIGDAPPFKTAGLNAERLLAAGANPEIRSFSSNELTFLLLYQKPVYLYHEKISVALDEIVSGHDVVMTEYPFFAPVLSDFCRKHQRPLVVTSHDLVFELHGSSPLPKARLLECEVKSMQLADAVVFCNDAERVKMAEYGVKGRTVLSTGDAEGLEIGHSEEAKEALRERLSSLKGLPFCLFVGSAFGPNEEAAAEMKKLARQIPKAGFVVAGNCCAPTVDGNFLALGRVSDRELDLLYRAATVVTIPMLRGTGISVKTFQALAYGKAIVSTKIGARAFPVQDGVHLTMAEVGPAFVAAVKKVLAESPLRAEFSRQARALALELDFRRQFAIYGEIIRELLPAWSPVLEAAKPRELLLVDNSLRDAVGHHLNYALAIRQECLRQGFGFHALVHREATPDVLQALQATPTFARNIHTSNQANPIPGSWRELRATYGLLTEAIEFAEELIRGLGESAAVGNCVFLPNATPAQMVGLAILLENQPVYRSLEFVLLLRYTLYSPTGPWTQRQVVLNETAMPLYRLGFERLHAIDQVQRIRWVTDSLELAKEYFQLFKVEFEVLPIPHTAAKGHAVAGLPEKMPDRLRVVFMGDARDEKGFEMLPFLIKACPQVGALAKVDWVFQAIVSSPYHQKMAVSIDEMARLNRSNLTLLREPLPTSQYEALLASADLVLLPYDAATYRARTSGPFMEAICAGKPVVIPKGTWMSRLLGESGAGVTFAPGNVADFIKATQQALENIAAHRQAAVALGQKLSRENNPGEFVRKLMQSGGEESDR